MLASSPLSFDKWGADTAENDRFGKLRCAAPPKTKGHYAFILHMIEIMKPKTGRIAVVASHSVLFHGSSEERIWLKLI